MKFSRLFLFKKQIVISIVLTEKIKPTNWRLQYNKYKLILAFFYLFISAFVFDSSEQDQNRISVHKRLNFKGSNEPVNDHARFQPIAPGSRNNMLVPASSSATGVGSFDPAIGEQFIKSCLNMFPGLAAKMSASDTAAVPENKYDLELQKEINGIQGRPVIYASGGSSVVSFDGRGINVPVKPDVTDISLNRRFT